MFLARSHSTDTVGNGIAAVVVAIAVDLGPQKNWEMNVLLTDQKYV